MRPEDESPALDARLADACLQLDLRPEPEVRRRLLDYLQLLQRWNSVYNLTALRTSEEMFTHHLLDCLAVVPSLARRLDGALTTPRLLDVGSGAGLPGIVLALLRPDWQVTCIDAVAKKSAFIRQVAGELTLPNLEAVHGRVELAAAWNGRRFDLILSRAFASLADFVDLTRPLIDTGGAWAAMKAQLSDTEIAALPEDVEMFHVEHLRVPGLDAQRRLAWLQPRAPVSPSPPAQRQSLS